MLIFQKGKLWLSINFLKLKHKTFLAAHNFSPVTQPALLSWAACSVTSISLASITALFHGTKAVITVATMVVVHRNLAHAHLHLLHVAHAHQAITTTKRAVRLIEAC